MADQSIRWQTTDEQKTWIILNEVYVSIHDLYKEKVIEISLTSSLISQIWRFFKKIMRRSVLTLLLQEVVTRKKSVTVFSQKNKVTFIIIVYGLKTSDEVSEIIWNRLWSKVSFLKNYNNLIKKTRSIRFRILFKRDVYWAVEIFHPEISSGDILLGLESTTTFGENWKIWNSSIHWVFLFQIKECYEATFFVRTLWILTCTKHPQNMSQLHETLERWGQRKRRRIFNTPIPRRGGWNSISAFP